MFHFFVFLLFAGSLQADKEYTNIELTGDTVPHDEYEARDCKHSLIEFKRFHHSFIKFISIQSANNLQRQWGQIMEVFDSKRRQK
jgi:hypothetical protein